MNQYLDSLIKLQQVDSVIFELNATVKAFPLKIAEAERPLRESEIFLGTEKQKLEAFEKKKREKERELEDINQKISKLKTRTSEIKTNKEYQALLKEIESVEKERSAVEDDILAVMVETETAVKQIRSEETRFKLEKEKIEAMKRKIDDEKTGMEKKLSAVKGTRAEIVDAIDHDIYDLYLTLIDDCNGIAVTEAKDGICQGCNMNIPPQLFVEIKKNEEILSCPQCRRILYFRITSP